MFSDYSDEYSGFHGPWDSPPPNIRYLLLFREQTASYLKHKLSAAIYEYEIPVITEDIFPGWEVIAASDIDEVSF